MIPNNVVCATSKASDQPAHTCSLIRAFATITVKLLTEHEQRLEFLRLTGGCTGSSEYTLVKMPHCWKSHVTAQILFDISIINTQSTPNKNNINVQYLSNFKFWTADPHKPNVYVPLLLENLAESIPAGQSLFVLL